MNLYNLYNLYKCADSPPSSTAHSRWSNIQVLALMLLIAAYFCSALSHALPNDRDQAITIQADEAERDEPKGTTTYSGAVVMEQGSMRISADKVTIYSASDKVTEVVAIGRPAVYRQQSPRDEQQITAQAERLEYQVGQETMYLVGNAALKQEGTSLSGDRIEYDVKKSIVKAHSKKSISGDKERVRMVIPPKAFNSTN